MAVDGAGNLFIADTDNHRIRKVDSAGVISTVAGTGSVGFSGDDGPAVDAQLSSPHGVAVDGAGNLFIADTDNSRIRKVDSARVISTVAGRGFGFGIGSSVGDGGPAVSASLTPRGVAVDGAGSLFIADVGNNRIRKVDSAGVISTVAGRGFIGGFGGDGGPATAARLRAPSGVAVDGAGNVYIADTGNSRIRKVDTAGVISTVAGAGVGGFAGFGVGDGGLAVNASLGASGVAVDGAGNLFIADRGNQRIRKVDSAGVISTVAGSGERGFGGDDGPAADAQLRDPTSVAVDGAGSLFIADWGNHRIRKVDSTGVVSTAAGTGEFGDGRPAVTAQLSDPTGVAADGAGNLFIADSSDHRIRKVDSSGVIGTVAGGGVLGVFDFGDGRPAVDAQLRSPTGVAADGAGNPLIAEEGSHRIRKVDSAGVISTVAGGGFGGGFGGDGGPAVDAQLSSPTGVAADEAGNLLIADRGNHRIRKVDSAGVISTVAGSGERGFGGDDGPAADAQLSAPYSVAADGAGNLFIADTDNDRIRKVDSAGVISTVAGSGEPGFGGDGGPAADAQLRDPTSVAVDGAGNLFIADRGNHRIRKVDSAGVISTVAGTGERGFSGDGGPAADAQLRDPTSVAVDGAGNLFIADAGNQRIRILTPATGPTLSEVLNTASFTPGVAPNSIASLFGERLAGETVSASELPLLAESAGIRIEIIDVTGLARAAQLLWVSPEQINFVVPAAAAPGTARLRLTREGEAEVELALTIDAVAPGLFSANGMGEGIGAITALRVEADGSRSNPVVFRYDAEAGRVVGVPLALGAEGDQLFLTLFGTGIRGAGGAAGAGATIGGSVVPVSSAGAQGGMPGLDWVVIGPLPRSLAGRGAVNVVVTAADIASNAVTIVIE